MGQPEGEGRVRREPKAGGRSHNVQERTSGMCAGFLRTDMLFPAFIRFFRKHPPPAGFLFVRVAFPRAESQVFRLFHIGGQPESQSEPGQGRTAFRHLRVRFHFQGAVCVDRQPV